jgi:predicted TIM-barrel fold metal-dependent hydrolase
LVRDTRSGHAVTATVFVESRSFYRRTGPRELRPVGETESVVEQSRAVPGSPIAAIVAFGDLRLGDELDDVLDAHEAAGAGWFRGVRYSTTWDADRRVDLGGRSEPGLMATTAFRRGVACLGRRGLTFDAWIYHPQLLECVDLARVSEETTIVLGHLGGPVGVGRYSNREGVRSEWRTGMAAVATCPNVVVKLGGIGMDYRFGTGWSGRERPPGSDEVARWWGDDIRWCVDTFGPSRCMFESNYPVDRQSLGYTVLWNAFQKIASGYSDGEQAALFAGTAATVYRIPLASAAGLNST